MRTTSSPLELKRGRAFTGPGPSDRPDLDRHLERFHAPARRSLRRMAAQSPRFADLTLVFPGAAYALATRRGAASRRRKAMTQVEGGALLKEVARTLELPLWLRRLPPEAFRGPLGMPPTSELFSRRIVNHLPQSPEGSSLWLDAMTFGAHACNEYFALWIAQQPIFGASASAERLIGGLAAYAWFSTAECTRAHALIVVPWRPEMAFDTAVCAAKSWINRMRLVVQVREGSIPDGWLAPGEALGFSFLPLVEQSQILAESLAMQNCADQYAERLVTDRCRLFSVRRNGLRVATLEIGSHPRETGVLTITQLKARHNLPATSDVWQAAYAWLGQQPELKRRTPLFPPERSISGEAWAALMAPYREARHGAAWIPGAGSPASLATLDAAMADLARRGSVTSWLFT